MDILNHVRAFLLQEHRMYQTTIPHLTNHLQHYSTKGHHDTLCGSTTLPFKWFSSPDILPFGNYPEFNDRYCPQYGMLTFLMHFMANTFFSTFLPLYPHPPLHPRFPLVSQSHSRPIP